MAQEESDYALNTPVTEDKL